MAEMQFDHDGRLNGYLTSSCSELIRSSGFFVYYLVSRSGDKISLVFPDGAPPYIRSEIKESNFVLIQTGIRANAFKFFRQYGVSARMVTQLLQFDTFQRYDDGRFRYTLNWGSTVDSGF